MNSRDGQYWDKSQSNFMTGLDSISIIRPSSKLSPNNEKVYDIIIIGAGYAGLTAARDLSIAGRSVLLLEARDRIGGRTWSADVHGHRYELGGAWLSWHQANVWREITRYDMRDELSITNDSSQRDNYCNIINTDSVSKITHDEEDQMCETIVKRFVDIDGSSGSRIMRFPHHSTGMTESKLGTDISLLERINQIKDDLSTEEQTMLTGFLTLCTGGHLESKSFHEFLHWWSLGGHQYAILMTDIRDYTLQKGQSDFARKFFDEALETGRLDYAFNSSVTEVQESNRLATIKTSTTHFISRSVITAVPLNILKSIDFNPKLSIEKQEAIEIGHSNKGIKINYECRLPHLRSWSGVAHSEELLGSAFGQSLLDNNNTVVVAYVNGNRYEDATMIPEKLIAGLKALHNVEVERIVFHDWNADPFSRGSWFYPDVGFVQNHLTSLRASHGCVHFASSDWAQGWRGFIDGAIEEGTRAAMNVMRTIS